MTEAAPTGAASVVSGDLAQRQLLLIGFVLGQGGVEQLLDQHGESHVVALSRGRQTLHQIDRYPDVQTVGFAVPRGETPAS